MSMSGKALREAYLQFFKERGHAIIPPAGLIPENDPTTLFTGSGMQPLVPYLLGEEHPSGIRLVDSQPSFRAEDIEEVGDNRHTTFFEMLGNWSLGDYFKKEQLAWLWEFLTLELGFDPKRLYVTVFAGDEANSLPMDEEAIEIWKKLFKDKGMEGAYVEIGSEVNGGKKGMQDGRIFGYEAKKNWWSRSGIPGKMPIGEPGGGDSEVFYEYVEIEHDPAFGEHCHPNCDCGRFVEIGNSVFMEYIKLADGSFGKLPKQNVDFGGGFERMLAALWGANDVFVTDLFMPIIEEVERITGKKYEGDSLVPMRVVADHMRAAVMMMVQGLEPSNKQQGYFLRRLIRRAVVKLRELKGELPTPEEFGPIVEAVMGIFEGVYMEKDKDLERVMGLMRDEVEKFGRSLDRGLKEIEKVDVKAITDEWAFDLFQTHGFPFELTEELVKEKGGSLSKEAFEKAMEEHQEKSRTASAGMFKGGLADHSENVLKYHTATHLLQAALRQVLGEQVSQKGSNLTGERLRFDFTHGEKLSEEEVGKVMELVNGWVEEDLPVSYEMMSYDEAMSEGALAFFGEKYPEQVKVYMIGDVSKELCGGPHVEHTGEIGELELFKQESSGAGVRRVYLRRVLNNS